MTELHPDIQQEITDHTGTAEPAKVILYNDNVHSFDEVILQLIKATGCSRSHAESIAWEVHTRGKAHAFAGDMEECIRVSAVLEEIALHTQIEL